MQIHIVRKGDTLWKISREYGVSFDDLKKINAHLANPEYIVPGMKIFIPETKKAETMTHPYGDNRPNKKGMMGDGTAQPYDGNLKHMQKTQQVQPTVAPTPKAQQAPQVPPIQQAQPTQTMPPIQPKTETKAIPIPIPIPIPIQESKPAPAPAPKPAPKPAPAPKPVAQPKPIPTPTPKPLPVQPVKQEQPQIQPVQVQPMPVPMPIPFPCPPMHQPVYTMPCPPMPCPPMPCHPGQPMHYLPPVQPIAIQPATSLPMQMEVKAEFEMPSPNSWMLIDSTSVNVEEQVDHFAAPSHPRMPAEKIVSEQVMGMFVEEPSSAMEMAYDYMQYAHEQTVQPTYMQPQHQQYPAFDQIQCSSCGGPNVMYAQPDMYAVHTHNPYLGGYPCHPQPNFHCPPYPHRHF